MESWSLSSWFRQASSWFWQFFLRRLLRYFLHYRIFVFFFSPFIRHQPNWGNYERNDSRLSLRCTVAIRLNCHMPNLDPVTCTGPMQTWDPWEDCLQGPLCSHSRASAPALAWAWVTAPDLPSGSPCSSHCPSRLEQHECLLASARHTTSTIFTISMEQFLSPSTGCPSLPEGVMVSLVDLFYCPLCFHFRGGGWEFSDGSAKRQLVARWLLVSFSGYKIVSSCRGGAFGKSVCSGKLDLKPSLCSVAVPLWTFCGGAHALSLHDAYVRHFA